jgi:hypothetical protein
MLDNRRLRSQLLALERRTIRGTSTRLRLCHAHISGFAGRSHQGHYLARLDLCPNRHAACVSLSRFFYQLESRACGPWPPPIKKPRHRTGLRPHEAPYSGEDASMSANNGACFIIRDHNGQALSYNYYENEPGRRAAAPARRRVSALRLAR